MLLNLRKIHEIAKRAKSLVFIGMTLVLGYAVCTPSGFVAFKTMIAIVICVASVVGIVIASMGMVLAFRDHEYTKAGRVAPPVIQGS
jgi:ABC-type dipeptide/oligopeptide/nickel transport system permease subunit